MRGRSIETHVTVGAAKRETYRALLRTRPRDSLPKNVLYLILPLALPRSVRDELVRHPSERRALTRFRRGPMRHERQCRHGIDDGRRGLWTIQAFVVRYRERTSESTCLASERSMTPIRTAFKTPATIVMTTAFTIASPPRPGSASARKTAATAIK